MYRKISTLALIVLCAANFAACSKKPRPDQQQAAVPVETVAPVEIRQASSDASSFDHNRNASRNQLALDVDTLYFEFDSYTLSTESRRILDQTAQSLIGNPKATLVIEGHCDERGSDEYNLALGERRARAAQSYLASMGIAPERITIISYGEERPAVAGQGEEAWSKNRRAKLL